MFSEIKNDLIPIIKGKESEYIKDSISDDLEKEFKKMNSLWRKNNTIISKTAGKFINEIVTSNAKDIKTAVKQGIGVDIFLGNKPLEESAKIGLHENINLIKTIGEELLSDVETTVYENILQGKRATDITKAIAKIGGISLNRAKFIATDQTLGFYAHVNRTRMQSIGGDNYIWHNLGDGRVRGNPAGKYPNSKHDHWVREGKKYNYNKPPADGNPGEPYGCRCFAQVILELLEFYNKISN